MSEPIDYRALLGKEAIDKAFNASHAIEDADTELCDPLTFLDSLVESGVLHPTHRAPHLRSGLERRTTAAADCGGLATNMTPREWRVRCMRCNKLGHLSRDCGETLVVPTDPLAGVSLADALATAMTELEIKWTDDGLTPMPVLVNADSVAEHLEPVMWAWFRANSDTIRDELPMYIPKPWFDALLDAAQHWGEER